MITVRNKHHGFVADNVGSFYIGRGSPLGNPYTHIAQGTKAEFIVPDRAMAISAYESWLREQIRLSNPEICDLLNKIGYRELCGLDTDLICFCDPKPCHGTVVKTVIQEEISRLPTIDSFDGPYRFLSNFWMAGRSVHLVDDSLSYPSTEHAYQAAKTLDIQQRQEVITMTAGQSKRFGRKVILRNDWESVKIQIMFELLKQKFMKGTLEAKLLDATGMSVLIEGNTWGDTFWGVCRSKGENHLGRLLMQIRMLNR